MRSEKIECSIRPGPSCVMTLVAPHVAAVAASTSRSGHRRRHSMLVASAMLSMAASDAGSHNKASCIGSRLGRVTTAIKTASPPPINHGSPPRRRPATSFVTTTTAPSGAASRRAHADASASTDVPTSYERTSEASGATAHHRYHTVNPPLVLCSREHDRTSGPPLSHKSGRACESDFDTAILIDNPLLVRSDILKRHIREVDTEATHDSGKKRVPFLGWAGTETEPLCLERVESPTFAGCEHSLAARRTQHFPDHRVLAPDDRVEEPRRSATCSVAHGRSQPISSSMSRTRMRWGPNNSSCTTSSSTKSAARRS